jgi:hypothetical protein
MILYELIVGHPAFPKGMDSRQVAAVLIVGNWRPDIPDTVIPVTAELIRDCLAADYHDRPWFTEILMRLEAIDFNLMDGVDSAKMEAFVKTIEDEERRSESHKESI